MKTLLLIALALALPARAEEFTLLIYESPVELAKRTSPAESASYWQAYNELAAELTKAGALRGGTALLETQATLVKGEGGADSAVKGARLGGYFVIEAKDLEAAKALARKAPKAAIAVELRQHRPNPTMQPR